MKGFSGSINASGAHDFLYRKPHFSPTPLLHRQPFQHRRIRMVRKRLQPLPETIPHYILIIVSLLLYVIMILLLIPRFAEILVLPARGGVQALRCRALTAGERVRAVRRVRKRSVNIQKPPEASFQSWQEFIGFINVGGAATEESTVTAAVGQTPGQVRPRWLRHLVRSDLSQQLHLAAVAAAAVRGVEDSVDVTTIGGKVNHLHVFVL